MMQLTKQSCEAEIKVYFREVLKLAQGNEEFPVNLDDVWPLVYARKDKAVRALKDNELFMQNIDYILLPQNGEQNDKEPLHRNAERPDVPLAQNGKQKNQDPRGGHNKETYLLSLPCLEFFIARKVRPVFEVYRKVFHKAVEATQLATQDTEPDLTQPIGLAETLQPLSDYMHQVDVRWESLKKATIGYKGRTKVIQFHNEWVSAYRSMSFHLSQLVHYETINKVEGAYFI